MMWLLNIVSTVLVTALLSGCTYVSTYEVLAYLVGGSDNSRQAAVRAFEKASADRGLLSLEFDGPSEVQEGDARYSYTWTRATRGDEQIFVSVSYLPRDIEVSVSRALAERPRK